MMSLANIEFFFMGNDNQWNFMARRLNRMNIGLDFDIADSLS